MLILCVFGGPLCHWVCKDLVFASVATLRTWRRNKWWSFVAFNWWLSFFCVCDKVIQDLFAGNGFNLDTNNCKFCVSDGESEAVLTVVQEMVLWLVMNGLMFFIHVLDPGLRKYVLYTYIWVRIMMQQWKVSSANIHWTFFSPHTLRYSSKLMISFGSNSCTTILLY